jgi:hypothetical protein
MKLSIAMVFVCLISLIALALFPQKSINASPPVIGACRAFPEDRPEPCDLLQCGGKKITAATSSELPANGGKYSLEPKSTMCKVYYNVQTNMCEEDIVYYFERVQDSSCCDLDGDGYSADNFYCLGTDCNDNNAAINPGATEVCDGVDNNCNGQIDEGFDQDGDGYKTCGSNPDCNDSNAAIRPGATEICDGVDNNCNGQIDEGFDKDGDGWRTCDGDCNDYDPYTNPYASPCPVFDEVGPEDKNCNWVHDA